MSTPQSFVYDNHNDMNASLWGELQNFIDLSSMIFAKLPLAPFFRLRQVCKEWNYLASNRQFLEQNFKSPISSNPYFIITRPSGGDILLTLEGSLWKSTPVPHARCEVSGLLFEDSNRNRIFDLHTRVFHSLPPYATMVQEEEDNLSNPQKNPLIGMVVDTTVIPYKFKVVLGNKYSGTRIYDSNSNTWIHNPSTCAYRLPVGGMSCVQYNKVLYIIFGKEFNFWTNVQTYDLERNEWNFQELHIPMDTIPSPDIGVWRDRWFVFAINVWQLEVVVWKTLPYFQESRIDFDFMPKDLCKWIMFGLDNLTIMAKFCGNEMFVYSYNTSGEERAVLYNLDQKTWDKIKLPLTLMLQ